MRRLPSVGGLSAYYMYILLQFVRGRILPAKKLIEKKDRSQGWDLRQSTTSHWTCNESWVIFPALLKHINCFFLKSGSLILRVSKKSSKDARAGFYQLKGSGSWNNTIIYYLQQIRCWTWSSMYNIFPGDNISAQRNRTLFPKPIWFSALKFFFFLLPFLLLSTPSFRAELLGV